VKAGSTLSKPSISRRAVQANDGTLNVRNLAGKGCVFTLEVPRHVD